MIKVHRSLAYIPTSTHGGYVEYEKEGYGIQEDVRSREDW